MCTQLRKEIKILLLSIFLELKKGMIAPQFRGSHAVRELLRRWGSQNFKANQLCELRKYCRSRPRGEGRLVFIIIRGRNIKHGDVSCMGITPIGVCRFQWRDIVIFGEGGVDLLAVGIAARPETGLSRTSLSRRRTGVEADVIRLLPGICKLLAGVARGWGGSVPLSAFV